MSLSETGPSAAEDPLLRQIWTVRPGWRFLDKPWSKTFLIQVKNRLERSFGLKMSRSGSSVSYPLKGSLFRDPIRTILYLSPSRLPSEKSLEHCSLDRSEECLSSTERTEDLADAAEQIRQVMRSRHRLQGEQPDDFTIRTQVEIGKVQEGTSETLTVMLMIIASVSLLVGGIGIMNILLVSVTERTREIGIRMAVGAKRLHILIQFLIEAMTLSVVGGCIGILFGVLAARLTTVIAGWPTIISSDTVAVAFVFSVMVGLFFGLYPANKAARLNPIEALRYE